eukprot:scaffold2363_cov159-Amphora_coffeaeformis.AAC.56
MVVNVSRRGLVPEHVRPKVTKQTVRDTGNDRTSFGGLRCWAHADLRPGSFILSLYSQVTTESERINPPLLRLQR